MKLKTIIGVIIVLVVAIGVWRMSPGIRTKLRNAADQVGGWSEDARKADPIGFIDYAEERLEKHMAELKKGRFNLRDGMERIGTETERNQSMLKTSVELADLFRTSFQSVETEGQYPVTVSGASYSRPELIEQVRLVLLQKTNYEKSIEGLLVARKSAKEADTRLLRQVTNTQAALAALPAKREILRVNKLSGEVDSLLGQIDALINENENVIEGTPVRTVEELMAGTKPELVSERKDDVDVMAFLGGAK